MARAKPLTVADLPSSNIGYADQQTGAYIGVDKAYPADEFESSRPFWWQIPGSVQASAAHNLTFTNGSSKCLAFSQDPANQVLFQWWLSWAGLEWATTQRRTPAASGSA